MIVSSTLINNEALLSFQIRALHFFYTSQVLFCHCHAAGAYHCAFSEDVCVVCARA